MKNLLSKFLMLLIAVTLTGCLKTRTQLREDTSEDREPAEYKAVAAPPAQEIPSQSALDEVKIALTQLEGRMQDLERSQQNNKSDAVKRLEARLPQIEQAVGELTQSQNKLLQAQTTLAENMDALKSHSALSNPEEVFKQANKQFNQGDFASAAEIFGTYLKLPKVKKGEEATYLKAESLYKLKEYKKAIVEYSKFPEKFPKSSKASEALYKIGLSFEALDMKDDAKGFYQEILEKYPKSPEAKKAKKKAS